MWKPYLRRIIASRFELLPFSVWVGFGWNHLQINKNKMYGLLIFSLFMLYTSLPENKFNLRVSSKMFFFSYIYLWKQSKAAQEIPIDNKSSERQPLLGSPTLGLNTVIIPTSEPSFIRNKSATGGYERQGDKDVSIRLNSFPISPESV